MKFRKPIVFLLIAYLLGPQAVSAEGQRCADLFKGTALGTGSASSNFSTFSLDRPELVWPENPGKSELSLIAIIPGDEVAYQHVFGVERQYTMPVRSEFSSARQLIRRNFDQVNFLDAETGGYLALLNLVKKSAGNYLAIVGHNDKGNLILPDGTPIPMVELARTAREFGKIPIFLSCNSKKLLDNFAPGVSSFVTFEQAAQIAIQLGRTLGQDGKTLSNVGRDLQSQLDAIEAGVDRKIKIRALANRTSAGLIVIALIVIMCTLSEECPPKDH